MTSTLFIPVLQHIGSFFFLLFNFFFIIILIFTRFLSVDKPPIEELYQFLDFQLPRQWAPEFGELALGPQRKQQSNASLQFSLLGPKLYVNTTPVIFIYLVKFTTQLSSASLN